MSFIAKLWTKILVAEDKFDAWFKDPTTSDFRRFVAVFGLSFLSVYALSVPVSCCIDRADAEAPAHRSSGCHQTCRQKYAACIHHCQKAGRMECIENCDFVFERCSDTCDLRK